MTPEYILRAVLRNLLLPPTGPLLLILGGYLVRQRFRKTAGAIFWSGFAALWLLATPLLADALVRATEVYPPLDLRQPNNAQAIVILSADSRALAPEYGDDEPGQETLQRLAYGAFVATNTGLPVLVSGGILSAHSSLASIMRRTLQRDLNTPVRWLEERSRDTHENAVFSAAILRAEQVQHVILVTDGLHMPRSVAEFRAAGLEVTAAPSGLLTSGPRAWILAVIPSMHALERSHEALYERCGDWVRRLRSMASQQ